MKVETKSKNWRQMRLVVARVSIKLSTSNHLQADYMRFGVGHVYNSHGSNRNGISQDPRKAIITVTAELSV